MPFCKKLLDNDLAEQFSKIGEEFCELAAENANLLNKISRTQYIAIDEIKKAFFEAFDVSQAAQSYMRLLFILFGKHYSLDFDTFFDNAIKKNADRGYYIEEKPADGRENK